MTSVIEVWVFDFHKFEATQFTEEVQCDYPSPSTHGRILTRHRERALQQAYSKRGFQTRNIVGSKNISPDSVDLSQMERNALEEYFGKSLDELLYPGVPDQLHYRFCEDANPNDLRGESVEEAYFIEEKGDGKGTALSQRQMKWIADNDDVVTKIAFTRHRRVEEEEAGDNK